MPQAGASDGAWRRDGQSRASAAAAALVMDHEDDWFSASEWPPARRRAMLDIAPDRDRVPRRVPDDAVTDPRRRQRAAAHHGIDVERRRAVVYDTERVEGRRRPAVEAGRPSLRVVGRPAGRQAGSPDRRPAGSPPVRRRPTRRAHERPGFQPDRVAMWAVLLGILLVLVAATSSHAAVRRVSVAHARAPHAAAFRPHVPSQREAHIGHI